MSSMSCLWRVRSPNPEEMERQTIAEESPEVSNHKRRGSILNNQLMQVVAAVAIKSLTDIAFSSTSLTGFV